VRYRLLGQVEVDGPDGQPIAVAGDRERVLLAVLLLNSNRAVSASRLIDAIWGEQAPDKAANALQVQVSRLRRKLSGGEQGAKVLRSEGQSYLLCVEPGELDLAEFERLVRSASGSPPRVAGQLSQALSLWRGRALADVNSDDVVGEVARLEELRALALERRIDAELALGRHQEVIPELEALVREQPLAESFYRQLMVALYRSGRQADALAVYTRARELLADELGVDPGPALRALELAVLNQSSELDAPALTGEVPTGQVTFLFTDIEGSTWLAQQLGAGWDAVLADHYRVLRQVWQAHNGYEVSTYGDAFFVVFADSGDALRAGVTAHQALAGHHWPPGVSLKVRIGAHTGEARLLDGDYVGVDVHVAARVQAAAHGGQMLISESTKLSAAPDHLDMSLTDLGSHRLKDIVGSTRLYQVTTPALESAFPPPSTLSALPNNFRYHLTSFIGREDDVAAVAACVRDTRLVTLIGAGGVGKTRLATQVAMEILDAFEGGAWLVDLARVSDPDLALQATASALGVREQPGRPLMEALVDHLLRRPTLVLLDNCEHLIDACASLVDELLAACPELRILATSREALALSGELLWRLRSLTVPVSIDGLEKMAAVEAVALFADRARAVLPTFEITAANAASVARICRRLDGMPLAIELAASRAASMSLDELDTRLDDRFRILTGGGRTTVARQRTLEATVQWSYELLAPREQLLFDRLSEFAGGCSVQSAEQVCAASPLAASDILPLLLRLVDRSMLAIEALSDGLMRYRMLETMRQFGRERLSERDETVMIRDRHLAWAVDFAESIPPRTGPTKQRPLDLEEYNLRAAFEWARARKHEEAALRIVGATWFGHLEERMAWFGQLLPPSPDIPPSLAVRLAFAALGAAFQTGQWELGVYHATWGVPLARAAGDTFMLSMLLNYEAMCVWGLGDYDRALTGAEEGWAIAQASGLAEAQVRALIGLTNLWMEKDLDQAEEGARRARMLATNVFETGHIDEARGIISLQRRDLATAAAQLADAVAQFKDIQSECAAHILESSAAWAAGTAQLDVAAELLGAAERIRDETGDRPRPNELIIQRDWLPLIDTQMDPMRLDAAKRRGRQRSADDALEFAETALRAYSDGARPGS
jgi:predicted ATPase/DNA-binding SARP family transcriptional activator